MVGMVVTGGWLMTCQVSQNDTPTSSSISISPVFVHIILCFFLSKHETQILKFLYSIDEVCDEHGMFLDAGEFTDYKYETLLDKFRDLVTGKRAS